MTPAEYNVIVINIVALALFCGLVIHLMRRLGKIEDKLTKHIFRNIRDELSRRGGLKFDPEDKWTNNAMATMRRLEDEAARGPVEQEEPNESC